MTRTARTLTDLPVGGCPINDPLFVPRHMISATPLLPSIILRVIVPCASGNACFQAREFAVPSRGVKRRPTFLLTLRGLCSWRFWGNPTDTGTHASHGEIAESCDCEAKY